MRHPTTSSAINRAPWGTRRSRGFGWTLGLLLLTVCFGCSSKPLVSRDTNQDRSLTYKMARVHEQEGSLTKARDLYAGLLAAEPHNIDAYHRLAVVQMRLGEQDQSLKLFREAASLAPSNAGLLSDYGYALHLAGDFEQAETQLRNSRQLDPTSQRTNANLAMVVAIQGRHDESLDLYRQVTGEAEAHANIAFLIAQQGDLEASAKEYARALDINPKLRTAAQGLLQLSSITTTHVTATPIARNETPATQSPPVKSAGTTPRPSLATTTNAASPEISPTPASTSHVSTDSEDTAVSSKSSAPFDPQSIKVIPRTSTIERVSFELVDRESPEKTPIISPLTSTNLGLHSLPPMSHALTRAAAEHLTHSSARPYGINESPLPASEPAVR